jgi:hypothetical protein
MTRRTNSGKARDGYWTSCKSGYDRPTRNGGAVKAGL